MIHDIWLVSPCSAVTGMVYSGHDFSQSKESVFWALAGKLVIQLVFLDSVLGNLVCRQYS